MNKLKKVNLSKLSWCYSSILVFSLRLQCWTPLLEITQKKQNCKLEQHESTCTSHLNSLDKMLIWEYKVFLSKFTASLMLCPQVHLGKSWLFCILLWNLSLYQVGYYIAYKWFSIILKDDLQSVLHSLSTLMFINIKKPHLVECELMLFDTSHIPYLWGLSDSFSNCFIDFYSCKVISSSDMKRTKPKASRRFACIMVVDIKLWIYLM